MLCPVCGIRLSSRCDNHGWPTSVHLRQRWQPGEGQPMLPETSGSRRPERALGFD